MRCYLWHLAQPGEPAVTPLLRAYGRLPTFSDGVTASLRVASPTGMVTQRDSQASAQAQPRFFGRCLGGVSRDFSCGSRAAADTLPKGGAVRQSLCGQVCACVVGGGERSRSGGTLQGDGADPRGSRGPVSSTSFLANVLMVQRSETGNLSIRLLKGREKRKETNRSLVLQLVQELVCFEAKSVALVP